MYVEEIWRVDADGEFIEMVDGTLGGVVRIAECERVEFQSVKRGGASDGAELRHPQGAAGASSDAGIQPEAQLRDSTPGGGAGATAGCADTPRRTEGGVRDRPAEAQADVNPQPCQTCNAPGVE
jgi:hypothetical protein